ncbi:MAG TPA: nicotinate-nucleotide adenylyltransferase [Pseudohaliea sp.]|nr:nicotinate-nucleotide adenylyltransferase [Pseudohaliea sp.]
MTDPAAVGGAPVGLLGGTFDPVHLGHLRCALELLQGLALAELRLVPGRIPPHRPPPRASAAQRLALVERAVAGVPGLRADDRELRRDGPSYTVDTLAEVRAELGDRPLCFVLGSDAFLGLPSWHRWRELTDHAHLVVMERPGSGAQASRELAKWLAPRRAGERRQLRREPAGRVLFFPVTPLDISASALRRRLALGQSGRWLLPEAVWSEIADGHVYGYPQVE